MEEIKNSDIHITSRMEIDHLHLHPNKHIVLQALKKYNPEFEPEYFSLSDFTPKRSLFIKLNEIQVFKSEFNCDLTYVKAYKDNEKTIKDFFLELYFVYRNQDDSEPLILNLDDLLFYLNQVQNQFRRKEEKFPELQLSFVKNGWYNFSTKMGTICNNYFPNYKGTVIYFEFDNELNELYAIQSNNIAFLYRYKERVFEEIEVKDNDVFISQIFMHPRFNNAISETAGSIYNFWERIAFVINEFFPLNSNSHTAPSYWKYFDEIKKRADKNVDLKNINLDWFLSRLHVTKEHERLNELRHPLIHYNKTRDIKGTRSANFIENRPDKNETIKEWKGDILFLRSELDNLSTALEKVISLIETWASANIKI